MTIKNETIVDRVVERLKSQPLGDLITEEDLHDIVKEAIPKTFFAKRVTNDGRGYSSSVQEHEPLIVEIMRGLMKESVAKGVAGWIEANQTLLAEHWAKVLQEGVVEYVDGIQREKASAAVRDALRPMLDAINAERRARGQMEIYV